MVKCLWECAGMVSKQYCLLDSLAALASVSLTVGTVNVLLAQSNRGEHRFIFDAMVRGLGQTFVACQAARSIMVFTTVQTSHVSIIVGHGWQVLLVQS